MPSQQDSIQKLNKHRTTTKSEGYQASSQVMTWGVVKSIKAHTTEIRAEMTRNRLMTWLANPMQSVSNLFVIFTYMLSQFKEMFLMDQVQEGDSLCRCCLKGQRSFQTHPVSWKTNK